MAYFGITGSNKHNRKNHALPFLFLLLTITIILSILVIAPLDSEDRISLTRGFYLFFLGLLFFTVLFNFINHMALKTYTGMKFKKRYHLSVSDILDISNKLVSSVQALLSCVTGFVVCTYSCTRDFLKTSHYVSEAYAWFGAAYFFYDIWSMYKVHTCEGPNHLQKVPNDLFKQKSSENVTAAAAAAAVKDKKNGATVSRERSGSSNEFIKFGSYIKTHPVILMHHLFIGSFGFLVIVYLRGGLGDCVFGYVYLMELSTPFVSLRGVFSRLGLKQSRWYVTNGLIMLGTFFFCRVIMFPYVLYLYSNVIGLPYFEAIMSLPRGCKIGILILIMPQFYWFYLMVRGATKVFCGGGAGAGGPANLNGAVNVARPEKSNVKKHRRSTVNVHNHTS